MASIEELKKWLKEMKDIGIYGGAAARVRGTAIDQLTTALSEHDPKDPAWLLANIDMVSHRWATTRHARAETAKTYKSRAKSTLAEYLEYLEDPSRFRGSRNRRTQRTTHQVGKSTGLAGSEPESRDASMLPSTSLVADSSRGQSFAFALSSGLGRLTVPFTLTALDIRILKKQIELLELQAQMGGTK